MDRNFHQTLYNGLLLNIKPLLIILFIVATFYLFKSSFKIFLSREIKNNFKNGRNIVKIKKKLRFKIRKSNRLEKKYALTFNKSVCTIVVLIFFFIFALNNCDKKGRTIAEALKVSIVEDKFTSVTFVENKKITKIAYLYCGSRNCAGIDVKTNEIVYFQQTGHRVKRFISTEM